MSLAEFQRAFGALVAAPALCRAVDADAPSALAGYNLSPREIRRLADAAAQPVMRANWTLHRGNRLTPLYRFVPRTLAVLGPLLWREVDLFWQGHPATRLQFEEEVPAFADFLGARISDGAVADPLVAEMLAFEIAVFRLLFQNGGSSGPATSDPAGIGVGQKPKLHPRIAIATFRHDPGALLSRIDARLPPPDPAPAGPQYLLLDARNGNLRFTRLPQPLGLALAAVQAGIPGGAAMLTEATGRGLVTPW
jgi:hypothetical protein